MRVVLNMLRQFPYKCRLMGVGSRVFVLRFARTLFIFTLGKKPRRMGRKGDIPEETSTKRKGAFDNKEDVTQNEKAKKKLGGTGSLKHAKARGAALNPEVEKAVDKFVKHATESGIEALREESRVVLEFQPPAGSCTKFSSMPERNRFPEIQCLDETRIVLEETEPSTNTYIHANRVKLEKSDRTYILTQGPKENTIEDFWRMIFQEQCAGVVMLCNYYEDGMQKCDEFFPTENGGYKYYGKMFVNNKKVDHLDQHDIYTLEILPDGCSNSILTRLAHCTTWPDKAVPASGRMVLRLLKWMQALEAMAPVAVVSGAGVGRAGTFLAIDQVCCRLFKGSDVSVKDVALEIRKQRAYAISNELQYFFVYSTVLDYIRAKIPRYHNVVSKFYNELSQAI